MKVAIEVGPAVKRAIASAVSARDPHVQGPLQAIGLNGVEFCLRWALDRDPKTARAFWKVVPASSEDRAKVLELERGMTHRYVDPLEG